MKLTEVKNERTFNLEISESALLDLLSVVVYWPADDSEEWTNKSHEVINSFHSMCVEAGVFVNGRTNYIEEL